jgi:hypothetical protein
VIESNLANTRAMFEVSARYVVYAPASGLILLGRAVTPWLLLGAVVAGILLYWRRVRKKTASDEASIRRPLAWLLGVPAALVLVQFLAFAAHQQGEYARFAVYPAIVIGMAAVAGLHRLIRWPGWRYAVMCVLVIATGRAGLTYWLGFRRDTQEMTTRVMAAQAVRAKIESGAGTIAVAAEPAPYSVPPVNLFTTELWLWPEYERIVLNYQPMYVELAVGTRERLSRCMELYLYDVQVFGHGSLDSWPPILGEKTAISWADKTFVVVTDTPEPSDQMPTTATAPATGASHAD